MPASGDTYGNGFLYNLLTNTCTTINVPGSAQTAAYSVSGSSVVGYYQDGVNGPDYGFLYDGVTYTILKPTESTQTAFASGISGDTVVGWYVEGANEDAERIGDHGFLYKTS